MATVVIVTALSGIFLVSSRCMAITTGSHELAVASAILNERMQQLRATPWETLTDSESYTNQVWTDPEDGTTETVDGLLKNATQSASRMLPADVLETVRIAAYRPVALATAIPAPVTATRNKTTATLTSAATNLVDEKMVTIELRLTWTSTRKKTPRSLELSSIVARQ
jgi:hypothetical protein